jgi:hypothetical protein
VWREYPGFLARFSGSPLVCVPAYQTMRSWMCHLARPAVLWQAEAELALPAAAVILFLLAAAAALGVSLIVARRRPAVGFLAALTWGVIFAPLGEQHHHAVVLVPIVVWLLRRPGSGRPGRPALAGMALALALYLVPFPVNHPALQSGWPALLAYPRLLAAWLVWLELVLWPADGPSDRPAAGAPGSRA